MMNKKLTCMIAGLSIAALVFGHGNHAQPDRPVDLEPLQECVLELPDGLPHTFSLMVPFSGEQLMLHLEKNTIFGGNTKFLVADGSGSLKEVEPGLDRSYLGRVDGRPGYSVSAIMTEDGMIAKILRPGERSITIEPFLYEGGSRMHKIFVGDQPAAQASSGVEASEAVLQQGVIASASMEAVSQMDVVAAASAATRPPTRVMDVLEYEIGVEIGSKAYFADTAYNGDLDYAQSVAQSLINNLDARFLRSAGIKHRLGTVIIRTDSATDPLRDSVTKGDSGSLSAFKNYWNGHSAEVGSTHDLAVYHVKYPPSGIAYVNSVGGSYRYALSCGNGATSWADGTISHEFGHSWNLPHTSNQEHLYESKPRNFSGSHAAGGDDVFVSIMHGGGSHNLGRLATYEADRSYNARENKRGYGDLVASPGPIAPFGYRDEVIVMSLPTTIDVIENDYDCNNDVLNAQLLDTVSQLGAAISLSIGTGPGGRNEILYTPPPGNLIGSRDFFHYTVVDPSGRTDWGCVYVTLAELPFGEVDTTGMLADSILDWDPASRISANWTYGYAATPAGAFSPLTTSATADLWIGGDAAVLQNGATGPKVGQYSVEPTSALNGIRRWTSDYAGAVTIQYDARRIQSGGDGCVVGVYHNGTPLWSHDMAAATPPPHQAGAIELDLAIGDTLDFTIDAKTSEPGDWTFFHARIMERSAVPSNDSSLLFRYTMDETVLLPKGEGGVLDRRQAITDRSGANHHASLAHANSQSAWTVGNRANALQLIDGSQSHAKVESDNLGDGATALTMSAWVKPYSQGQWKGIVYARGDGSQLFSFASSGYVTNALETRFLNFKVDTAANSIQDNAWTHIAAVWQSGSRYEIYLDGQLVVDHPSIPIGSVDIPNWYIGTADHTRADRSFDGKLDDVALWSRALSAAEIEQLYLSQYVQHEDQDSAEDDVYIDGWTAGDNGGTGFGAWEMSLGSGTATIGDSSALHPDVDINSGGKSFRLVCDSGYAHAWRDLNAPLREGQTLALTVAAGVAASNKGVDFRPYGTDVNGSLFNLGSRQHEVGGTWYVNTPQGRQYFSDGPHPNTWFQIEITQVRTVAGREQGVYTITRHGEYSETIEGVYFGHVGNFKVYGSTDGATDADAIYFNDLVVKDYVGPPIILPTLPEAEDYANDPAYSDGWSHGDNGGRGFTPWHIELGSGTATIEDSTALAVGNSGADVNTNGVSFKLYHPSGGYIQCLRGFEEELAVGITFSLSIAVNQSTAGMNKGLNVNAFGATIHSPFLFGFRLAGGSYYIDGGPTFSDGPSANTRFDCSFTQTDESTFAYEVVRSGDFQETLTGTLSGRIGGFKFYGKMGDSDPEDAVFFNNIVLMDVPEPPAGDPDLRITGFSFSGLDATLSFASESGVLYDIQGATDLPAGNWSNLILNVVGTEPDNTNTVDAAEANFFRVKRVSD